MFRLLLAGDLHLGRASRLGGSVRPADVSCASAWGALVELAIDERVDLVVLSGDVVDSSDRFWEARFAFERGVQTLGAAGIRTLAVAGNHDWNVLPRIAGTLPGEHFRLLGADGSWERETIERDGRPVLHVDGWSFPSPHATTDPLAAYDLEHDPEVPVLGVAHGDLDAAASVYAPIDRGRLARSRAAAWLLGHVHAPELVAAGTPAGAAPWALYPGSLQAMDAGETGVHGAWRADVEHGRIGSPVLRPLSSVRYERIVVDLDGAPDGDAVESRTDRTLHERTPALAAESGARLRHLVLRLELAGRTPAHAVAERRTEGLLASGPQPVGSLLRHVDRVIDATLPDIDLVEHAKGGTPVSALARLLLDLDGADGAPTDDRLLVAAREAVRSTRARREYAAIADDEDDRIDDELVRDHLRDAARTLLGALLEQAP